MAETEPAPVEVPQTEEPAPVIQEAPADDGVAGTKRKLDDVEPTGGEEDPHIAKRPSFNGPEATENGVEETAAEADPEPEELAPGVDAPPGVETAEEPAPTEAAPQQEAAVAEAVPEQAAIPELTPEQQAAEQQAAVAAVLAAGAAPVAAAVDPYPQAVAQQAAVPNLQGLTQVIHISAGMVGKLIGKAGETIKGLQYSTNARIQIDHSTPGDHKAVTVTGPTPESVASAVAQINELMRVDASPGMGEVTEAVPCPPGIVGRIIGRGGETIRGLQQASQAHIVVNQDFPEGEPRQIKISGKPDAVERAVKMVQELIQGEPGSAQAIIQKVQFGAGVSRVVECPKGMVGRVIGKGGETIKALQRTYQVNIQIDQGTDPMRITVAGQPHTVDTAATAVAEIINGGNPFGAGGPASLGGSGAGGFGGGGYGGAAAGGGYGAQQAYAQPAYGGFGQQQPAYGGYGAAAGYAQPYGAPAGAAAYPGYGAPAAYPGYGAPAADPYAQAYGGYGGAAPAAAGGGGASVWQELQDEQGRSYYYNAQTGVSQWEKPPDM